MSKIKLNTKKVSPKELLHYVELFYTVQKQMLRGTYLDERYERQYESELKLLKAYRQSIRKLCKHVSTVRALRASQRSHTHGLELQTEQADAVGAWMRVNLINTGFVSAQYAFGERSAKEP